MGDMEKKSTGITPANGGTEAPQSLYIRIPEAMALMDCSRSTAQRCFASINAKLKKDGLFVIAGRCLRSRFYEAIGYEE